MNELVPINTSNALMPKNIDEALRLARLMAQSKMMPKHIQGDEGTAFLIVEQALRWQMSPFAVAQCTSNIGGRLMWEGKLVAAAATSCGAIVGEFDYEFEGNPAKPETLSVTARATRASDNQVRAMTLRWVDAKTDNQFWRKQPEQQLSYAVARVWCRRWSPGVILGVFAPEEFDKAGPQGSFVGTTIDAEIAPAETAPKAADEPPQKLTITQWLDALAVEFANAENSEAVDNILARSDVQKAQDMLRNGARDRLQHILDEAIRHTAQADDAAEAEAGDQLFADPASDPFRQPVTA